MSDNKYKINIDRPEPSREEIESHQDFNELLGAMQNIRKPIIQRPLFWAGSGLVAACAVAVLYFVVFTGNSPKNIAGQPFINPPMANVQIKYVDYEVQADSATIIRYASGTRILIPAGAFADANGNVLKGKIKLQYREFHDMADCFLSGIPMSYDSAGRQYDFQTAGMFDIKAFSADKPAYIASGKNIQVQMASAKKSDNFNFYKLDTISKKWAFLQKDTERLHGDTVRSKNNLTSAPVVYHEAKILSQPSNAAFKIVPQVADKVVAQPTEQDEPDMANNDTSSFTDASIPMPRRKAPTLKSPKYGDTIDTRNAKSLTDDNIRKPLFRKKEKKRDYEILKEEVPTGTSLNVDTAQAIETNTPANSRTSQANQPIVNIQMLVAPKKADPSAQTFTLDVDTLLYPEFSMYKNVVFQVGKENVNFDPNSFKVNWTTIKLTKGSKSGSYNLTLGTYSKRYGVVVYPVYKDGDYDAAKKLYNQKFAEYEKGVKNKQRAYAQRRVAQWASSQKTEVDVQKNDTGLTYSDLSRVFNISSFGIYNCDHPCEFSNPVSLKLHINDIKGQPMAFREIYLVDVSRKFMHVYNVISGTINVRFDPNDKNFVFTMMSDGKLAICNSEKFAKIEPKNYADANLDFDVPDRIFANPAEIRKYVFGDVKMNNLP